MKDDYKPLYFHEEVLLLALRDERGALERYAGRINHAISGAILSELLVAGSISTTADERKLVTVERPSPLGDPLLDECLSLIRAQKRRRGRIGFWLSRFMGLKNLQHRAAEGLCSKKILTATEGTFLLVFKQEVYPEVNPEPERDLIERIRSSVLTSKPIEDRTAILVALAQDTGLLAGVFQRRELRRYRQWIEKAASGQLSSQSARTVISAVRGGLKAQEAMLMQAPRASTGM